ncbi:hypothetical protein Brms1b_000198 [Colletotrichum noveboracense]|nr:hypothetical protein COL940_001183 [Colletotrichum noveboracense]KAJ0292646.1 hypothetical protein CBS470a_002547 [Colletotrichum nupharicola]KAJ0325981.1 hypothetical protein Brms1b_000198 [Colletotrichum noveboracense]
MTKTEDQKPEIALEHADDVGLENQHGNPKDVTLDAAAKGQGVSGYETLTLWETFKAFKVCSATCFAVAFSAATDGYQIGINGNIIANPGFINQFATETTSRGEPNLAASILSAWSSIMSVGQIIGMTTVPFLSDRFGRKGAMYWYWFILSMSILCESVAQTWPVWLVAKLLAGVGVGCLQSTVPTYIAEVAPTRIRGGLLLAYNFWFALGQFFAPVALQVMSQYAPEDWKTPIYTQWSQIGLMIIIYVLVPESPAWCVTRGKLDAARKSLRWLYRGVEDYDVEQQLQLLVIAVDHEMEVARSQANVEWYAIFKGVDGKRTVTALWTLMTQQFVGLTLFSTFASYFFKQAGIKDPFQATCITSGINIVSGLVFILNIGMTANGATGWGFIGEISSQRLRPYTAGFGAASTCVAGVVMNVLTPYMVDGNQWNWELKTAWFYTGVGLPFVVAMWFLIPETKGRSAAELDELFERGITPWRFHKTLTATERLVNASHDQEAVTSKKRDH